MIVSKRRAIFRAAQIFVQAREAEPGDIAGRVTIAASAVLTEVMRIAVATTRVTRINETPATTYGSLVLGPASNLLAREERISRSPPPDR